MTPFEILKKALIGRKINLHKPNGTYFHFFDERFGKEKIEATILDVEPDTDYDSEDIRIFVVATENSKDTFEWMSADLYQNFPFVEDVNSDIDNNQEK